MNIEKEKTTEKFLEMIKNSWTFEKMTKEEQKRCINLILDDTRVIEAVKGTAKQRWAILNSCYASYLIGLGYTGFNWRDK